MGRRCSVCGHPDREAIDRAIVGGEPCRAVAARSSLSPDAVERHAQHHLPAAIVKAAEAVEVAHGEALYDQVRAQQARAEVLYREAAAILHRAKRQKEGGLALEAIRTAAATLKEARQQIELLAHIVESREEREIEEKILLLEHRLARLGAPGA